MLDFGWQANINQGKIMVFVPGKMSAHEYLKKKRRRESPKPLIIERND